jgi:hypothetical protein
MSSNQSGEGDIRRALIEADLVDCIVALAESAKLEQAIKANLRTSRFPLSTTAHQQLYVYNRRN